MSSPKAVLLDVGGVLFLPDHARLLGARSRAGCTAPVEVVERAHYAGAQRLGMPAPDEVWPQYWSVYVDAFLTACECPDPLREDAHEHLLNEHTVQGLWTRIAPGSRDGLEAL